MKKVIISLGTLMAAMTLSSKTMAQERKDIEEKYKWNLCDLYASDEAWTAKMNELIEESKKVVDFKGKLSKSGKDLLAYFEFGTKLSKEISRLSSYASMKSDEDLGNADNNARVKVLSNALTEYSQLSSFATAELAAIPKETIEKFLKEEPGLNTYRMTLDRIERNKIHTLSADCEALMAKTAILGSVPEDTYNIFSNAEMPWPTITLENGTEIELNQAGFSEVRASANRNDREKAFDAFWKAYKGFEGTFGELLNGQIRETVFYAKARNYESALESALYHNNIPTSVYHSLVENVNKNLPTFHRYLKLKQRLLGVDQLKYSDLYAPAVKDVDLKFTYEEGQKLVLEAIKPLGEEYRNVVSRAFNERWIDVYPSKGKASGAYSNGSAYDVHPYIKLNYNGQYDAVGTLIHELGHTMHSYFSNKVQPYPTARYSIFVAEVASTFNEALLDDLMMKKLKDKEEKISLLMSMLDGFKGTLFRQTQFAEFELRMHEMVEQGKPVTGKALTDLYGQIVRKYYGDAEGVCKVNENVDMEWAFIPHFYMGFYVYQYSTSFVASQALAEKVLSGDKEVTKTYLHFLTEGGSKYPIDILKNAGVDMTTSDPFEHAIKRMNDIMDQIEALLDK